MSEYLCKTVRVVSPVSKDNPHGYIVINESDLKDFHEIFTETPKVSVADKLKVQIDLKIPQQLLESSDTPIAPFSDTDNQPPTEISLNDNEDENLNANDGPEAKKPWEVN